MATTTQHTPLRLLTFLLWLVFLGGNAILFAIDALPGDMPSFLIIFGLLILFLCWLALLIRYFRALGQWRSILLFGLCCSLALFAASLGNRYGMVGLASVCMAVAVYSIFAAWFAAVALAVRRDVSVAFLAVFFLIAPLLFRAWTLASGGVLAIFQSPPLDDQSLPYSMGQTTVMVLSCLAPLALLTFLPHFVWLWVKEWRRQPLT